MIEIPGEEEKEVTEGVEEIDEDISLVEEDQPQISVHALNGSPHFQTMRVTRLYGKTPLLILIDSGSTHNILDISIAKKLGCKMEAIAASQ